MLSETVTNRGIAQAPTLTVVKREKESCRKTVGNEEGLAV